MNLAKYNPGVPTASRKKGKEERARGGASKGREREAVPREAKKDVVADGKGGRQFYDLGSKDQGGRSQS